MLLYLPCNKGRVPHFCAPFAQKWDSTILFPWVF